MQEFLEHFDVAVIGSGPAGMMAAGRAAELGARVALVEKTKHLAQKLLLTGNSRCNVTNNQTNDKLFVQKIGPQGKFLFSALAAFGPEELMAFLTGRGVSLKTEAGGRVFPTSDKAEDILNALKGYLEDHGVKIFQAAEITDFNIKNKQIESLRVKNLSAGGRAGRIVAKNYILATGGKSYPTTGSTGDGYVWAKKMGHTIVAPEPALVPIATKEAWVGELQGVSLKNVRMDVLQNGKKRANFFGEMLFTHFGLSGPLILNASKQIGRLLKGGEVVLKIDLKPEIDKGEVDKWLQRIFSHFSNKNFENYLAELVPRKMIGVVAQLAGIAAEKKIHSITREERRKLGNVLKELTVTVAGLLDFDQAIVTSGGVDLNEVNSKTMQSRIISNLFFAGEILDLDGPTGGYNLQICWSTGYAAGTYAAGKK